ncbi:hypothetical protein J2S43_004438 [Catenuloplanes nepalensis]|uniref:Uncharacterized protein n=1 Tax=Catenuloplanes nepalensis TaxID=587533 RepID=A0ABT9MWV7_9ACTN|nr:hypothetical protein [Catenuloplanes nepalensis]MDP9795926.1 hypothetical protein [Catenuloplanes nepalensis]
MRKIIRGSGTILCDGIDVAPEMGWKATRGMSFMQALVSGASRRRIAAAQRRRRATR